MWNCFLAAARTASLTASITNSRSMPCSWQSASIFCAIVVLIYQLCFRSAARPVVLYQMTINSLALTRLAKFLFRVDLQIRFSNSFDGNLYPATCPVLKDHITIIDADYATAKIPLAFQRPACLDLCRASGKAFVVGA